ncbi:MAG: citrate/2-methylcitrate synthase [Polyangiales bacterium]
MVDPRGFANQRPGNDDPAGWLDASAAIALLGVKRETLYAYASRGLVETRPEPGTRRRRYRLADLERLRARHDARAGHAAVAASALRWGEPVLDSAITELAATGPRYRGVDAVGLALEGARFEDVAELLFTGRPSTGARWASRGRAPSARALASLLPRGSRPIDALTVALPALALADADRFDRTAEPTLASARSAIFELSALVGLFEGADRVAKAREQETVAKRLAVALGASPSPRTVSAIERALVLSADHELNPSSFGCRVAASTGADLHACFGAALGCMLGVVHGGQTGRIESLVDEVGRPDRAIEVLRERMRRGEEIPGFGHPLYPEGDPRTPPLLALARELGARRNGARTLLSVVDAMELAGHPRPTIDLGTVAIAEALGLPRGSALVLFTLGRTAGWVAHVLEQRAQGFVLRPRARYVGAQSGRASTK